MLGIDMADAKEMAVKNAMQHVSKIHETFDTQYNVNATFIFFIMTNTYFLA